MFKMHTKFRVGPLQEKKSLYQDKIIDIVYMSEQESCTVLAMGGIAGEPMFVPLTNRIL